MIDSTADYNAGNFDALRAFIALHGYLFVRKVIPHDNASEARKTILTMMLDINAIRCDDGHTIDDAIVQYEASYNTSRRLTANKHSKKDHGKN